MTEGEERVAVDVHVGEALGDVVLVLRRDLVGRRVDGVGETAGGVCATEENIGDGVAAFFAGPPCFDEGGGVLFDPRDGEGAGVHHDDDGARIGGDDGLDEVFLVAWEGEGGAIAAFGFDVAVGADEADGDVGIFGGVGGFAEFFFLIEWGRGLLAARGTGRGDFSADGVED